MGDTPTNKSIHAARPRGISMYDDQYEFALRKARELTKRGRPSVSSYIQKILDDAMRREKREKREKHSKPQ